MLYSPVFDIQIIIVVIIFLKMNLEDLYYSVVANKETFIASL